MTEDIEWGNEMVHMDDVGVCVEVVFEGSEVPYDTYRFGSLDGLTELLSPEFLEKEIQKNKATGGRINNIYLKGRTNTGEWRMECRIGNQSAYDLESFIMKKGDE